MRESDSARARERKRENICRKGLSMQERLYRERKKETLRERD